MTVTKSDRAVAVESFEGPASSLRLCAEPQMRSSGEIWMDNKLFRAGKRYLMVKRILAVLPSLTTLMM